MSMSSPLVAGLVSIQGNMLHGCHDDDKHAAVQFPAGVCFYQRESLPGYSAIFKHPNEELNFCYYLIPCGDKPGQCGNVNVRRCRSLA